MKNGDTVGTKETKETFIFKRVKIVWLYKTINKNKNFENETFVSNYDGRNIQRTKRV